jgi:hypothetical protein
VQRGRHPPLLADTIPALQHLLRQAPRAPAEDDSGPYHRAGGRRAHAGRRDRRKPRHRRR